jgi:hypothetical protein
MRRMRGEIGRFFLLALALALFAPVCACVVPVFLAGDLPPAIAFDFVLPG